MPSVHVLQQENNPPADVRRPVQFATDLTPTCWLFSMGTQYRSPVLLQTHAVLSGYVEFETSSSRETESYLLVPAHLVLTMFMDEHGLTGEGTLVPTSSFSNERHLPVGTVECQTP